MTGNVVTLPVIRIERQDDEPHEGPVCLECGAEFYYDFVPEPHLGSGLCLNCFYDRRAPAPIPQQQSTTQEKT